jgi:hypothetical protein
LVFALLKWASANSAQVIFEGETTWGYEEWSGPLFSVSGENIVVTGASGHSLNGDGSRCRYRGKTFFLFWTVSRFSLRQCVDSPKTFLIRQLLTPSLPRVGWRRIERRQNQAQVLLCPRPHWNFIYQRPQHPQHACPSLLNR